MSFPVIPTRKAGFERLRKFLPNSGHRYAKNRNKDYGPDNRENVSLLSGHIRHRLILEKEILSIVLGHYSQSTAEKFIQELFWRGYFKGFLEQHPTIWTAYRRDVSALTTTLDNKDDLARFYYQAVNGETDISCFNSWAHELVETGYLHNHVRMWFASIWIFTLKLPWQLGADFFYRHLVDGDPASNTLSWRWVGGLHTSGKSYLARPSNIERYTDARFAPYGQLTTNSSPLEEDEYYPISKIPATSKKVNPEVVGLLITEEEGYSEDLFKDLEPTAGIALLTTHARSPQPIGIHAKAFSKYAFHDSISRAVNHFKCTLGGPFELDEWGTVLLKFAREHGVQTIATAYAPVGPVAEKLSDARSYLAKHGIALYERQRAYDLLTWPYAKRGFFSLKKKIPDILKRL
ncbi:MAG: DNA photolyase [Hyphomicrobiaceae bacterium]|nr:DNA photolyase [Hyphomicrobiaceae bacterium]